jgi:hypothetical protein
MNRDEFVFGDFPCVENSVNSDSLELLVLLFQDKRTLKEIILFPLLSFALLKR